MKTSIIMTSYNKTRFQCHMTMEAIANITKFTDLQDYELIVLDPEPDYKIRDDYNVLKIDKWLQPSPDPGYTACMNIGAKEAKHNILVFIQNDVFVHEGWLPGLMTYIKAGYQVVWPDQVPRSREYVKQTYERDWLDPESMKGGRDAGLMMITRSAFEKIGGWDEKLSLLAEKDFMQKIGEHELSWTDTNKVIITHIMAATNLDRLEKDPEQYDDMMRKDAEILNG